MTPLTVHLANTTLRGSPRSRLGMIALVAFFAFVFGMLAAEWLRFLL